MRFVQDSLRLVTESLIQRKGPVLAREAESPSRTLGRQLEAIRKSRKDSQQKVVDDLKEQLGVSLPRESLARIESGERGVSLDEALQLAAVLRVSPTNLVTPRERKVSVQLGNPADGGLVVDAATVRAWIAARQPLRDQDADDFYGFVSEEEEEARRTYREVDADELEEESSARLVSALTSPKVLEAIHIALKQADPKRRVIRPRSPKEGGKK